MRLPRRFLAGILFSLIATAPVLAQAAPRPKTAPAPKATPSKPIPAPRKITTVEGITEYRLANGLTVLLFPDETKQTITVNVTYKVGSRQENYGETGMAHLLEHMLFKGTPSVPSVFVELGRRGMEFNGNTSYDRTTYFETFTAAQQIGRAHV